MSQTDLALDVIRKKVFYHNSVDVWMSACEEKNIDWNLVKLNNFRMFDKITSTTGFTILTRK